MDILIYEHACGGGFAEGAVSPGILAEGFGMLRLCVANLKAAGHRVSVVLDEGLSRFNPPIEADCVIPIFNFNDAQQAILKACTDIDAAYVIAPETGGTLHALVELIEQNGVPTFNSRSNAIRTVSNKANLYKVLKANKLKTPKTIQVNVAQYTKEAIINEFDFPVVFKPIDGVGCSGLSIVEEASQIEKAIEKIDAELASETFMVQEYLKGETVSVSLLCTGTKTLPVSLNKQNITLLAPNETSAYIGGAMPFGHKMKQEAFELAEAVISCFSGLKGYVGVDMILTDTGPVVVDVNPRLTTSFIGLSRITDFNFADAITNATLKNSLPTKTTLSGYACFSKIEMPKANLDVLDNLYEIPELVSPPFPVQDSQTGCALISVESNSWDEAYRLLEEAKKHVLDIM
ncbi:MAG: ATP-grasp domain-containing protein [Candidatus Bathyarchaeota archaeon]|nr:ATP-grasp domain-containing protein [Candidatus Termiticorpusculum sp.]